MNKLLGICLFLFFGSNGSLSAQTDSVEQKPKAQWSIYWNGSLELNADRIHGSKFTALGFGIRTQKIYQNGIGIEAKISYRHWYDINRVVIPLYIGPSYTISSNNNINFLIRSGLGAAGVLGNDYASVFFGFEIGPELQFKVGNDQALLLGLTFSQAMAFHPGHFEYLDFTVGWQF